MSIDVNPEVRQRLFAAADQLYEQGGHSSPPNVDSVRRLAKANMNDASVVMREWRSQRAQGAAPAPTNIPDEVRQENLQGLTKLWNKAQEQAGDALRAAQSSWDQQRRETEALCEQLSEAFDQQGEHCAELARALEISRNDLTQASTRCDEAKQAQREMEIALASARQEAAGAGARAQELAHRVEDLRQLNSDLRAQHAVAQSTLQEVNAELSKARASIHTAQLAASTAEAQRDSLANEAVQSAARERSYCEQVAKLQEELAASNAEMRKLAAMLAAPPLTDAAVVETGTPHDDRPALSGRQKPKRVPAATDGDNTPH